MKPMHFRGVLVASAAAILMASGGPGSEALSQNAQPTKAEQAIKYRQSVYKVILWNFAPMAAAVRGEAPYDAAAFASQAQRVAQMAPMLLEGYPHGSHAGAPTRARPALWENMEEFRTLMKTMEGKATDLAAVAGQGDFERARVAFAELGNACKACHDKYRSD